MAARAEPAQGRLRRRGEESARLEAAVQARRRRARVAVLAWQVAIFGAGIGLWWLVSATVVDAFWISTPGHVARQLWSWTVDGTIPRNLGVTLEEMAIGLVLACLAAVVLGLVAGLSASVARVLDPYVSAAYNVPHLAFIPLLVLIFGIGINSKVALVFLAVFFVVFYNVIAGAREVDQDLVDTLRVLGAGKLTIFRKVLMPSMAPWLFVGLRLGIRNAFAAAVVGEMISATEGVGWLVQNSAGQFDSTGVYAGLVYLIVIAVALNWLVSVAENRVSHRV